LCNSFFQLGLEMDLPWRKKAWASRNFFFLNRDPNISICFCLSQVGISPDFHLRIVGKDIDSEIKLSLNHCLYFLNDFICFRNYKFNYFNFSMNQKHFRKLWVLNRKPAPEAVKDLHSY
jgi:hypothetical protein